MRYNSIKVYECIHVEVVTVLVAKHDEIKKRRLLLNLNQKQLSLKAGLPCNAIYRIENQKINYTHPIRAKAIAQALGCDVIEIFDNL